MSNPSDHYVNSSTTADEEKRREALMTGHTGIPDQYAYARSEGLPDESTPKAPKTQENARTGN
jgi:hypothetical protein